MLLNTFKEFKLKWWQASIYEVAMISLGIVIGARWSYVFENIVVIFLIIFLAFASYIAYTWYRQLKRNA